MLKHATTLSIAMVCTVGGLYAQSEPERIYSVLWKCLIGQRIKHQNSQHTWKLAL